LELTVAAGPPPSISTIEPSGNSQVVIRFAARSNWTYVVQSRDIVRTSAESPWTNFFTMAAQPSNTQVEVHDAITNAQRFYRLLVLP
jgi:hypothetical protein